MRFRFANVKSRSALVDSDSGAANLRFLVECGLFSTSVEGIGTLTNRCRNPG
jgi:hypothetical protein